MEKRVAKGTTLKPDNLAMRIQEKLFNLFFFFKILFICERDMETQAEGEAGSPWGAQCGT